MNDKAGNFGDVPKHFLLLELMQIKMKDANSVVFYDAFGGNYITGSCRDEARLFLKNATENMKCSLYYRFLSAQLDQHNNLSSYHGSSKLISTLFESQQIEQGDVVYNSYNIEEVIEAKTLADSESNKRIQYRSLNAYHLVDDFKSIIRYADSGVIFLDPFYADFEYDFSGCEYVIQNLIDLLRNNLKWSIVLWVPYFSEKWVNRTKEVLKTLNISSALYSLVDPKFRGDDLKIKGVGMLIINDDELENKLIEKEFQNIGDVINYSDLQFDIVRI